jgi:hypothetical protein
MRFPLKEIGDSGRSISFKPPTIFEKFMEVFAGPRLVISTASVNRLALHFEGNGPACERAGVPQNFR